LLNHVLKAICGLLLLIALVLPDDASATPPDSLDTRGKQFQWKFSAAGSYYAMPADDDIPIGVFRADLGNLHLEGRYNYEDLKTASVFGGWTLATGESFTIALTPMAGFAFGRTTGIVPALEASLDYDMFDFYGESEYLFDVNDKSGNFLYSWLELGIAPTDLFRGGFVAQRKRIIQSPLVVDRGLFVQLNPEPVLVSLYAFNLFTDSWFMVMAIQVTW
jgi:hypothetical protein